MISSSAELWAGGSFHSESVPAGASQSLSEGPVPFGQEARQLPCLTEQLEAFRCTSDEGLQASLIHYSASNSSFLLPGLSSYKESSGN